MSPSPAPAEIPATDPCWTLMDAFRSIPDPRHPRGIRHPLSSILALCIIAPLSGRQNLTQIHRFAKDHPEVLEALGTRRRWVPVTTTLSTVLGLLRIGQLQDALAEWVCGLFRTVRSKAAGAVAAVDGKTSRASKVHVLNVFALDMQQAVWQCAVDEKANEITALRKILTALFEKYPFLKILTGDAMFAGNPLCSEIITHGRRVAYLSGATDGGILNVLNIELKRTTFTWRDEEERLFANAENLFEAGDTDTALARWGQVARTSLSPKLASAAKYRMAVAYLEKAKENVDAAYKARDEIEDGKLREQLSPLFDAGKTESPLP